MTFKPSVRGARVAKRLLSEHGVLLIFKPEQYSIRVDREAISANWLGGDDYFQWYLYDQFGPAHVTISLDDGTTKNIPMFVGSPVPVFELLRYPKWDVERAEWATIVILPKGQPKQSSKKGNKPL